METFSFSSGPKCQFLITVPSLTQKKVHVHLGSFLVIVTPTGNAFSLGWSTWFPPVSVFTSGEDNIRNISETINQIVEVMTADEVDFALKIKNNSTCIG